MTSWGNQGSAAIRLGHYQAFPEGTFVKKSKPATVVTAYYEFDKSKYTQARYNEWIELFCRSVPCYLVFFCEASFVDKVKEWRAEFEDRTLVLDFPRESWTAHKFGSAFWQSQLAMDPEKDKHCIELYKIWYEKKEFVKRVISLNPFSHDDFVYTDAGILRYRELAQLVRDFPVADRIPTDRVLLMNVMPFSRRDETLTPPGSSGAARIGGGIIAANQKNWILYDKLYDQVFQRYVDKKLFIGKDQTLMATLVLENKSFFSLLDAKPIFWLPWFYLLAYLGANNRLFARFRDKRESMIPRKLEDLIRLSQ